MIEWGAEFINVRPPAPEPSMPVPPPLLRIAGELPGVPAVGEDWTAFVAAANANASALQGVLNDLHGMGGGIVYFPPGRYYLGRNVDSSAAIVPGYALDAADVLVYPEVTLRFAPGAVLVPLNFEEASRVASLSSTVIDSIYKAMPGNSSERFLVRVEIQGEIEADLVQIFDTVVRPDTSDPEPLLLAGVILFTSLRVREVYPEWWGAVPGREGLGSTRGFQAAIDAAHTHRHRPQRRLDGTLIRAGSNVQWWRRPAIPVFAVTTYTIEPGLEVGVRTIREVRGVVDDHSLVVPNTDPFVLFGAREVGNGGRGSSTLTRGGAPTSDPRLETPMLSIQGLSSFTIRDVTVNGGNGAKFLVHLELGGESGHGEFTNCVFTKPRNVPGATAIRIRNSQIAQPSIDGSGPATSMLAFTRCRIQTDVAPLPSADPISPGVRGIELNVSDDVNVEFRGCWLTNYGDPMIAALRGKFTLNECTLHTFRYRQDRFSSSSNGSDVFIFAPQVVNGEHDAPACFTAREVESQSFQHVATFSGDGVDTTNPPLVATPPTGSISACTLLNVHHSAVPGGVVEAPTIRYAEVGMRPSIYWEGPGRRGSHLIAVGCHCKSEYGAAGNYSGRLGSIRVNPPITGQIYSLGNMTFNPSFSLMATGPGGVRPPDFIVSHNAAIVPGNIHQLPIIDVPT